MTQHPPTERVPHHARYEIKNALGRGSMGVVYRAADRELGHDVALKYLHESNALGIAGLKAEFRSLCDIHHHNLVDLYELNVDGKECFFTMELVDGEAFSQLVPNALSWASVMDLIGQLGSAVDAIHSAGKLHRDIKPTNVLVEPGGRVVVLDFGLVAAIGGQHTGTLDGTPAYMAPELFEGASASRETDWFSVGVLLHEFIAGRPPAERIDAGRIRRTADLPSDAGVPDALVNTIELLLDPDPPSRLEGWQALSELGSSPTAQRGRSLTFTSRLNFVGRRTELDLLHATLDRVRSTGTAVVEISGESGIGKTRLVEEFIRSVATDALCLVSRCRMHESVRFKGIDGIVDELAGWLRELKSEVATSVHRDTLPWVLRAFPVLEDAIAPTDNVSASNLDASEQRRRAFEGLCGILVEAARHQPMILWVDDAQWGDPDSASVFRELVEDHVWCRAPILILISYRANDIAQVPVLTAIRDTGATLNSAPTRIELGPLDSNESDELARSKVPPQRFEELEPQLSGILEEAAGSPLWIDELVRSVLHEPLDSDAGRSRSLADALDRRVSRLAKSPRELLELVSIAGHPLRRSDVLAAAGLEEASRRYVTNLCRDSLLRYVTIDGETGVDTYHARIAESIAQRIDPSIKTIRHLSLAESLEAGGRTSADILCTHFHRGAEPSAATRYAILAGDEAVASLAFLQGAEFYRRARDWSKDESDDRGLEVKRANALVNAGHCVEAAPLYEAAAARSQEREADELFRLAAEQYLVSGHLDEGLSILRPLLHRVRLRFPSTGRAGTLHSLWLLGRLALRRVGLRNPVRSRFEPDLLFGIDLCDSAARGLALIDPAQAGQLALGGALRAIQVGEPRRLARGLNMVGSSVLAPAGGALSRWGERLIGEARRIGQEINDPYLLGSTSISEGNLGIQRGDWVSALENSERGVSLLREHCRGVRWEINAGLVAMIRALEEQGQFRRARELAIETARIAEHAGDKYGRVTAILFEATPRIASGDTRHARRRARAALTSWSATGFHIQHFYATRIEVMCDLYEGEPQSAWERLLGVWRDLSAASLLRVPIVRTDAWFLRGRVALALGSRRATSMHRERHEAASVLERINRPDAAAHAALIRAAGDSMDGNVDSALSGLEHAAALYEACGMQMNRACVDRRLAELAPGRFGEVASTSSRFMIEQGVADLNRWTHVCAPGFPVKGSEQPDAR